MPGPPADMALWAAAETGDVAGIEAVLRHGAGTEGPAMHGVGVECRDRFGRTALVIAASNGHADAVDALVRAGADAGAADNIHSLRRMFNAHARPAGEHSYFPPRVERLLERTVTLEDAARIEDARFHHTVAGLGGAAAAEEAAAEAEAEAGAEADRLGLRGVGTSVEEREVAGIQATERAALRRGAAAKSGAAPAAGRHPAKTMGVKDMIKCFSHVPGMAVPARALNCVFVCSRQPDSLRLDAEGLTFREFLEAFCRLATVAVACVGARDRARKGGARGQDPWRDTSFKPFTDDEVRRGLGGKALEAVPTLHIVRKIQSVLEHESFVNERVQGQVRTLEVQRLLHMGATAHRETLAGPRALLASQHELVHHGGGPQRVAAEAREAKDGGAAAAEEGAPGEGKQNADATVEDSVLGRIGRASVVRTGSSLGTFGAGKSGGGAEKQLVVFDEQCWRPSELDDEDDDAAADHIHLCSF